MRRDRDPYVRQVTKFLPDWMENQEWANGNTFYITQLQVLHEDRWNHWVMGQAISKLIDEGALEHYHRTRGGKEFIDFISLPDSKKYLVNDQIKGYINQINWYASPKINRECGLHAEDLFEKAMSRKGFVYGAKSTRKWKGKIWDKSSEDLDYIFSKDSINYGIEIKNTFRYVGLDIFLRKIDICDFLDLVPLIVVRQTPFKYQDEINDRGGFVIRFKTKLFPTSYSAEVKKLYDTTRMPVKDRRDFPERAIDNFIMNFHNKTK